MCLAQGPQRSDADQARTRGPSVSSQALYYSLSIEYICKLVTDLKAIFSPTFYSVHNRCGKSSGRRRC